jgi:hypothetical protein
MSHVEVLERHVMDLRATAGVFSAMPEFAKTAAEFLKAADEIAALTAALDLMESRGEPDAWLVRGGRHFRDSAHISRAHAERAAANDKAEVVPLYALPPPPTKEPQA